MSKDNSESFTWMTKKWLELKLAMEKTGKIEDINMYEFFLLEVQKLFTKLYAKSTEEDFGKFYEKILNEANSEIKRIRAKVKGQEMPF